MRIMSDKSTWVNGMEHIPDNKYHPIDHLNFNKRLHVLEGWLMDAVIEDLNIYNHNFHFQTFMKQTKLLGNKFPLHEELHHLDNVRIIFWSRYQEKYKKFLLPKIKKIKKEQIKKDLKSLGF